MRGLESASSWSDGLLWRFVGLLASGWFAAGLAAAMYVETDRRVLVALWAWLFLPCWLSAVWMWRPWHRIRRFIMASVASAILFALRLASHAHELTPDGPADDVAREIFVRVFIFQLVGVLVWSGAVAIVARRSPGESR